MASPPDRPAVVHRIASMRHPFLDGTGAFLFGGRWNSRGKRVVYTSESFALATLEYLVNANIHEMPVGYGRVEVRTPPGLRVETAKDYHAGSFDHRDRELTQSLGDRWLERGASLLLIVPSAVTGGIENNVLINPLHKEFSRLVVSAPLPIAWDERLFRVPSGR